MNNLVYTGFEVGPIRPPSEATSLMIRITRNCPWNKCKFCTLYKGENFSIRPIDHIKEDINKIKLCIDAFKIMQKQTNLDVHETFNKLIEELGSSANWAYSSAKTWYENGMKSIFLQDANSMVIEENDMVDILKYIRKIFGNIDRITSYARSQTIAKISDADLKLIAEAGLNRLHVGFETASDKVLALINKGVDKESHILAGQKIKRAGIELSEYFMPGIGGNEYSMENAIETADALNQIDPDFIRIRTLSINNHSELAKDYESGIFTRTNDNQVVIELKTLIENLEVTSYLTSDHILNLIPEIEGQFPEDKAKILKVIEWYLNLSSENQIIYRVGRRINIINSVHDYENPKNIHIINNIIAENKIDETNIDNFTDELIKRFI